MNGLTMKQNCLQKHRVVMNIMLEGVQLPSANGLDLDRGNTCGSK